MKVKDVIIGGGEVGSTLFQLLTDVIPTEVIDIDPEKSCVLDGEYNVDFIHICIPYTINFESIVKENVDKYKPKAVIIHSTVLPGTGETTQEMVDVPVISSPIRGRHEIDFLADLKKYVKWYGINDTDTSSDILDLFEDRFKKAGCKVGYMSTGKSCELAKILCDTTYHGWLIAYRNATDLVAKSHNVNPDEMWQMCNDAPTKPIMYSDKMGIGGHCVMPNLSLINDDYFRRFISSTIEKINRENIETNK